MTELYDGVPHMADAPEQPYRSLSGPNPDMMA
jgi:hypothetical protein